MVDQVRRPIMRYFGGKWRLAPWIISLFPEHRIYTEAFGGAGSVLLRKPRAYSEVYNDLDSEIVNVFRVLRDPATAQELQRRATLTPFSREEYETHLAADTLDDIGRALRVLFMSAAGFANIGRHHREHSGFRSNVTRSHTTPSLDWSSWPQHVQSFIDRLSGVVIEHADAHDVLRRYDTPQTLHYVDPPYVWGERNNHHRYNFDMDDEAHAELAETLQALNGMVLLSGYNSRQYECLFEGWLRIDRPSFADGARPRRESVWLNPAATNATPIRLLDL